MTSVLLAWVAWTCCTPPELMVALMSVVEASSTPPLRTTVPLAVPPETISVPPLSTDVANTVPVSAN